MQIQQLTNLTGAPDTNARAAASSGNDTAAFSRTLANALEGSEATAKTARGVISELREAVSGQSSGDAISRALNRLQAQWGEGSQPGSGAGSGPMGDLSELTQQLRGQLEQLRAGLEAGSTAQREALNDLINQMDQLQSRLEADGDGVLADILQRSGSIQPDNQIAISADKVANDLGEQLEAVRKQLEQLQSGENIDLTESPALGALLQQLNSDPQRLGGAARATQTNMERNLTEQAQALRQIIGENAVSTASRQADGRTDSLLTAARDGNRGGEGMNNTARETFSGSLAALSGSASGGTPSPSAGIASTPATGNLTAQVGTQAWDQQLNQQMIRFSQQSGEQRVNLQLHPPELGSISVRLTVNEQNAQAQFLSHNAQVRQALEQAIPQLRDALAEQGVSLGETSVGEQSTGEGNDASSDDMPVSGSTSSVDDPDGEAVTDTTVRDIPLDGRVDIYA